MQGHIRFIAHYPTIMRLSGDVENISGIHFSNPSVGKCGCRTSRQNHTNMLNTAIILTDLGTNICRPFPTWLVRGAPDSHSSEANGFELSFIEVADVIWTIKSLQYYVIHIAALIPAGIPATRSL
ncbi:MAG: hypothetical protein ACI88G_001507 [Woeseiaceae bacterium]|jgi:hypothetical protein